MEEPNNNRSKNAQQPLGNPPEYLAVGRVVRPHGVRGNLLVAVESDIIRSITPGTKIFLGPDHIAFTVRQFSPHRNRYLLGLETLNSRTEVENYRGTSLYLRFEDTSPLPEGEYYYWQLLGLEVVSDEDNRLGILEEIIQTGANDVYLVRSETGDEILLPAIEAVIKDIDLDKKRMLVHLLPGL